MLFTTNKSSLQQLIQKKKDIHCSLMSIQQHISCSEQALKLSICTLGPELNPKNLWINTWSVTLAAKRLSCNWSSSALQGESNWTKSNIQHTWDYIFLYKNMFIPLDRVFFFWLKKAQELSHPTIFLTVFRDCWKNSRWLQLFRWGLQTFI